MFVSPRLPSPSPDTSSSITHTDRSVQAITDGMSAVTAEDPNEPELLQQKYSVGVEGGGVSTSQDMLNGVNTLLDWEELVRTSGPVAPFGSGLLEAENGSTNGSSGYSSNPASPPWPLSTTASSSASNLWSSSSSPHQWCPSPKEEEQSACGAYGAPVFAQTNGSEMMYANGLSVLDMHTPPSQVDMSIDDMLFSVLNTPSWSS